MTSELIESVQHLLRELAPQVLSRVLRRCGDFSAAEDAVQEALLAAATQWPREGTPENPRAWLVRVAMRRLTDQVRADSARKHREALVVSLIPPDEQIAIAPDELFGTSEDDTLDLLFMCCHPCLTEASAIALTLRAIGGLTTPEIARAFLVPEGTMAQRISRAKQSIQSSGVPFERPTEQGRAARMQAVAHVLYLIFNEGYTASSGDELHRTDLSQEAIRVTRLLLSLAPDEPEVAGLLALMLLTDARRPARSGPRGELIPLDEQDRSLWDQNRIAEGTELLTRTLPRGATGPYQLLAAIAALHDEAARAEDTDWPQILALYSVLLEISDNPMVALNHAIALAMVHGAAAGLERLEKVGTDPRLREHYRLDAVRAHLLERTGDPRGAAALYRRAAARTTSRVEQEYLLERAGRIES
ncbi:MAG TPA: sigma-70 family RNA polymerase sigma factor [Polyangiaceae bacterium]|nr:sigma-70 family RNA polymerase sigma factor [Polyangiaceae bacterium]